MILMWFWDQVCFIPPMNVRAYGIFPLNYALLKSKPGFSSWNLSSIIFFFSSSSSSGFKFRCPLNTQPHLTPFCAFCTSTTIYFLPFSRGSSCAYHKDSYVSSIPSVSWEIYGGLPLIPIERECALNFTSIIEEIFMFGGRGGGSMYIVILSRDYYH